MVTKKIIIEKTIKEERLCDICGKKIIRSINHHSIFQKCLSCKKDLCNNCRLILFRRNKVRSYVYQNITVGVLCPKCCKKKGIKVDWSDEK